MASARPPRTQRAARHHWWFISAWLVAAILCVVIAAGLDGQTNDTFKTPGAQSQKALDLLEAQFPSQSGATATVVFRRPAGRRRPAGAAGDPGEHREPREAAARLERREPDPTSTNARSRARSRSSPCSTTRRRKTSASTRTSLLQQATAPADRRGSAARVRRRGRRLRGTTTVGQRRPHRSPRCGRRSCCSRSVGASRWASRS